MAADGGQSGVQVRPWEPADLEAMTAIWNEVVRDGRAFPQVEPLSTPDEAAAFFASQTRTAVAVADGAVAGLSIRHPNNVGRCGHIANASYAVASPARGRGVGRALVSDSLAALAPCGFRGLQFNAVVASNVGAVALYESLGFTRVGTVPEGFRNLDGVYEDIHVYYHPAL